MSSEEPSLHPVIDIDLSRPAYRLGGTVVGTVRFIPPKKHTQDVRPRDWLGSLRLCVAGRCRLDSRWHNVSAYQNMYGKHPALQDSPEDPNSICFWTTEPIELLDLQERMEGRWEDAQPKPIQLPGRNIPLVSAMEEEQIVALEQHQLAYTFRVDLPTDLPHTLSATSCRYYYTVMVRAQLSNSNKPLWVQMPLTILAANFNTPSVPSGGGHVKLGSAQALAHSAGLPCYLTATELHKVDGQITVNRQGAALYRHVRRQEPRHLQTMRVADPGGQFVCVLTAIGVSLTNPGSRAILRFEFPRDHQSSGVAVPCYQVCACLQGEEVAIHRDGTRNRARSYLFSTAHELIDPACTECASLDLMLPLDAPCTVQTNLLAITIQCTIDITVGNGKDDDGYRNLRLEIPCQVIHSEAAYENKQEDDENARKLQLFDEILYGDEQPCTDPHDPRSFPTKDITDDLKCLSLSMADNCGIRPKGFV